MTQIFAVDENNDLYVGPGGTVAIARDLEAVLQACDHAAKTILAEMVLATDQGLPYFEAAWAGTPNVSQFEAALRAALLAVDGVTGVSALSIGQIANALTYQAQIVTVFGAGNVNG